MPRGKGEVLLTNQQGGITIDELKRSKRKTMSLEITRDARLIVHAPVKLSLEQIYYFIRQKRDWIRNKQEHFRKNGGGFQRKDFRQGEDFLYLGESFPLVEVKGKSKLKLSGRQFEIGIDRKNRRREFEKWFRKQAAEVIKEILARHIISKNLKVSSVKINNARRRWGSCSSKGNINFSWRLVMAPQDVIEYVVVHELAHLKHKNHGVEFWKEVEAWFPAYKERKRWLKDNGHLLSWE